MGGLFSGLFGGGYKGGASTPPGPIMQGPVHTNPAPGQIVTTGTGGNVDPTGSGSVGAHPYNPNEIEGGAAVTGGSQGGAYTGSVGGAGFASPPAGAELLREDELL